MSNATEAGARFEKEIANLYRMLGYSVTPNFDFQGFQIDLAASRRVPGADQTRLMIECKFKSRGSVSNEEVSKLSATFTEAGRDSGFHKAVLVTNRSFSQKARAFAMGRPHLVLKTLQELEDETLDVFTAYGTYKRNYQELKVYDLYVPLGGIGYLPGESRSETRMKSVEASVMKWVEEGPSGFLTILADFGAGKTTLLERIKYHFCVLYEQQKSAVKPMFFRAKELHKFNTVDEYLAQTAREEFGHSIDVGLLWGQIRDGRFLLLIDGFDEVAQRVDPEQRRSYFVALSALFNSPCHSIMTCRPTFFIDSQEYDDLVNEVRADRNRELGRAPIGDNVLQTDRSVTVHRLAEDMAQTYRQRYAVKPIRGLKVGHIHLSEFAEGQVRSYLKNRDGEFRTSCSLDWKKILKFLYAVYDIKDLMRRPILLDMIVRTILSGEVDPNDHDQHLGAADIYEAYIRALLDRERSERETRRLLTSQTRQALLELVAVSIYQSDSMDASFRDLLTTLADRKDRLAAVHTEVEEESVEHIAADIVLIGFLTCEGDGTFRFAHKSFMEFLVARFIMKQLAKQVIDEIVNDVLPKDIVYFLGAFLIHDRRLFDDLMRLLRASSTQTYQNLRDNVARAVVASNVSHEDFSMTDVCLSDVSTKHIHWRSADLERIRVELPQLERQRYTSSVLREVSYKSPEGGIVLEKGTEFDCSLSGGAVDYIVVQESAGSLEFDATTVEEATLKNSTVHMKGSWWVADLTCQSSSVRVTDEGIAAQVVSLDNCADISISSLTAERLIVRNCTITFDNAPALSRSKGTMQWSEIGELCGDIQESTIFSSPFTNGVMWTRQELKRFWSFANCKMAGPWIEPSAASGEYWPDCEGVLFYQSSEQRRVTRKSMTYAIEDRLLIVDLRKFREDAEGALSVLDECRRLFSPWIDPWADTVQKELEFRLGE